MLSQKNKLLGLLVALVIILGAVLIYWHFASYHPKTNNAYVNANIYHISPALSGRIESITVSENQQVHAGDILLDLDKTPYLSAVSRAEQDLQLVQAQQEALAHTIDVVRSSISMRQTEYEALNNEYISITQLPENEIDREVLAQVQEALNRATLEYGLSQTQLTQLSYQWGGPPEENVYIQSAELALQQAKQDLEATTITAPVDGIIGPMDLGVGAYVSAGQMLFPLVNNEQFWIDANYKETDVSSIQVGQSVIIKIDMYPKRTFHGTVLGISPASGATLSLLAPENAVGNWVKVTQRFPVQISIDDMSPDEQLRVGASASVTINTRS